MAVARTRFSRWFLGILARMARPPRRAYPTKAGVFVLGAPIVLGMAAVTSSNNLLFLLLGGTLGAIVLSGVLSERNIRPISVRVRAVSVARAMEPTRLEVEFERNAPVVRDDPVFSLELREASTRGWLRALRGDVATADGRLSVVVPVLEGPRLVRTAARVFPRRGRARLDRCELSTCYPFGLLVKTRDVEVDIDVLVRPRRVEVPDILTDPRGLLAFGERSLRRGIGLEVLGLREREERDPVQRVHALRSLSLGKEVVLEMAGTDRPQAELGIANVRGADPEAFERAIEIVAATLDAWNALGFSVSLRTVTKRFDGEQSSTDAMSSVLARLELEDPDLGRTRGGSPIVWVVPKEAAFEVPFGVVVHVDSLGTLAVPDRGPAA